MSGFRLFRRKKLAPGLRLNLSRSGPSLRIGPRGAGITVGGRRGLRTTVGVPGTGIYYTRTAGGHQRVRRSAAPLRSSYAGPATTTNYKGCLYVIGAIVLLALAIVTYGLILIPVAIGIGVWIWYRRRQPDSIAGRIIKQALAASPPAAVHLLNQAIEADPHGPKTLRACASWFYDHQCWQDAAEAYAGLLHTQSDWASERRYVTCLLAANRPDEAIPRLEHLRSVSPADDGQAALLGQLATAYLLKGDVGQATAFIDLAPLQKRNLDSALQGCLYLRATIRYLSGDRRRAIADLERLYAVNPAMPAVVESKTAMAAGTFKFAEPQAYPDWYPSDQKEGQLPSAAGKAEDFTAPENESAGKELPPAAQTSLSTDAPPMPASQNEAVASTVAATRASEPVQQTAEATTANPALLVSADGAWRWDGTRWLPNAQLQAANVPPDWLQSTLWRNWDSPLNLIRGESRHQEVFLPGGRSIPPHSTGSRLRSPLYASQRTRSTRMPLGQSLTASRSDTLPARLQQCSHHSSTVPAENDSWLRGSFAEGLQTHRTLDCMSGWTSASAKVPRGMALGIRCELGLTSRSRSRKSALELVAEPFADLPPLAGVTAAILLGVVGWAAPLFAGTSVIAGIWLQFGRWLIWLLAGLILAYTVVGVGRRFIDRRNFDASDDSAGLTWNQFERLIAEFYRRKGATVSPRGGPLADGGVDLVLTFPSGERQIVQCKHWKNRRVGVKPVRELWGVVPDEKADGAIFVTSGSFSPDAIEFARGKSLELIDGPKLHRMMAEVRGAQVATSVAEPKQVTAALLCPRCDSPMILRTARRGAKAGEQFWGCSTYPKCQGTRPLSASA